MERRESALKYFNYHKEFCDDYVKNGIEKNRKGFARLSITGEDGKPLKGAKVKIKQNSHDFKFGCNIFMLDEFESDEKNALYRELFKKCFNYATIPFYWSDLEPEYGKPRYDKNSLKVYRRPAPDLCVEYCRENNIRMKGHCLAYDTSAFTPEYFPRDIKEAKKFYERHFAEIAERYANVIDDFDITNELLCHTTLLHTNNRPALLREYDYLDWLYEIAYKYFPHNLRYLNEAQNLGDESFRDNRTPYYMMIERHLKNGGKCNAISMQAHSFIRKEQEAHFAGYRYNPIYIAAQSKLYADFKLPIQISEVTISAFGLEKEDEEIQAEILTNMYKMWFASPYMEGIVYWNMVDGYAAWAKPGSLEGENYFCGGLLRYDMTEKPAMTALKELLKGWQTNLESTTDENGELVIKGFYGNYDLEIETPAGIKTSTFHLDKFYERPHFIKL